MKIVVDKKERWDSSGLGTFPVLTRVVTIPHVLHHHHHHHHHHHCHSTSIHLSMLHHEKDTARDPGIALSAVHVVLTL